MIFCIIWLMYKQRCIRNFIVKTADNPSIETDSAKRPKLEENCVQGQKVLDKIEASLKVMEKVYMKHGTY